MKKIFFVLIAISSNLAFSSEQPTYIIKTLTIPADNLLHADYAEKKEVNIAQCEINGNSFPNCAEPTRMQLFKNVVAINNQTVLECDSCECNMKTGQCVCKICKISTQ